MPRARPQKQTHTGRSKIADESQDNRPKTRRLEGGGDSPLIFFTCRSAGGLLPSKHLSSLRFVWGCDGPLSKGGLSFLHAGAGRSRHSRRDARAPTYTPESRGK